MQISKKKDKVPQLRDNRGTCWYISFLSCMCGYAYVRACVRGGGVGVGMRDREFSQETFIDWLSVMGPALWEKEMNEA